MSISAMDHCLPFGSVTDWRSTYRQLSMLQGAIAISPCCGGAGFSLRILELASTKPHRLKPVPLRAEQLGKRSCDLRPGEWFGDQHHLFCITFAEALVGYFRRIADYDDWKLCVGRIAAQHIEK